MLYELNKSYNNKDWLTMLYELNKSYNNKDWLTMLYKLNKFKYKYKLCEFL